MKAMHNTPDTGKYIGKVVLYPKDMERGERLEVDLAQIPQKVVLWCIPKIRINESNSQLLIHPYNKSRSCVVSQRYG